MATLTKAEMLALLADNTTGDISAEDFRNIIIGVLVIADEGAVIDQDIAAQDVRIAKLESYHANEPTGFNLRDTSKNGIMEICPNAAAGMYWRLDENSVFSKITGATTFGDGVTSLADRTFCHRPTATDDIVFWLGGDLVVKDTAQILALDNVSKKQIISYDLVSKNLIIVSDPHAAIRDDAVISVITGNPTVQNKVVFANERHGYEMSSATHEMLHETIGASFGSGLEISGMSDNGNTFTAISAGTFWDEDIQHIISDVSNAPFAYRDSIGDWALETLVGEVVSTNALNFQNNTASDALYNRDNGDGTWSLVDTGSDYVIMHIFITNDGEFPIFKLVGQDLYADRTEARRHLEGEMAIFRDGDLPTPEFLHLYSYILDGNGVVETGLDGEIYIDYRLDYPISRY